MECNSCNVLYINGVKCHERGCPEAWKDEERECKWCGNKFKPEKQYQDCCCHSCHVAYHSIDCDCDECRSLYEDENDEDISE
jgi:hypothetical protein